MRTKTFLGRENGVTLVELLAVIVILGIIAAVAIPSIGKIVENSRIKAEKENAMLVMAAANLYFVENSSKDGFTNSVGVPTLISERYLEDEGLANNSLWVADAQPAWICGMAYTGKNQVEFRMATAQMIRDSGTSTFVGTKACGDMPEKPD